MIPFFLVKLLLDQEVKYLSDNLESFFTLVYPKYEIIFCVRDYDDSAVPIVEKLINKYPDIPAKLLIGKKNITKISISPVFRRK